MNFKVTGPDVDPQAAKRFTDLSYRGAAGRSYEIQQPERSIAPDI